MEIEYYNTYDLPIPYKKLKIYPVTVKDYTELNYYSECLTFNKNDIPDPKIIKMSKLEFLYYITKKDPEKQPYLMMFDRLLSLCLKDDKSFDSVSTSINRYNYDEKGKPVFVIENNIYNGQDFEEIRKIICSQNMIEMEDESISKEVRDSLEKARAYKEKISGDKPCSFEDYMISLSVVTGWSMDYIYSLTIRKFIKSIRRLDNFIHYKIYLSASMSGMVEFKDKSFIKHWLSNIENKDKYGDVSTDMGEIQSKISLESAKIKESAKYER